MKREETQSRETGSTSASALSINNPHEQITHLSVSIQASAELTPAVPAWFGEVVLVVTYLKKQGVLMKLCEQVRFARKRFGRYEVVDFLAVLFGYAHAMRNEFVEELIIGP